MNNATKHSAINVTPISELYQSQMDDLKSIELIGFPIIKYIIPNIVRIVFDNNDEREIERVKSNTHTHAHGILLTNRIPIKT